MPKDKCKEIYGEANEGWVGHLLESGSSNGYNCGIFLLSNQRSSFQLQETREAGYAANKPAVPPAQQTSCIAIREDTVLKTRFHEAVIFDVGCIRLFNN